MAELSIDKFTDSVINAMGPKTSPRVREVMTALIRHMHDFAREVKLTTPEYLAACDFVVRIGKISNDKRNEAILASDIFGLESLVDFLDQGAAPDATPASTSEATSSAILGPFWREQAPECRMAPQSCRAARRARRYSCKVGCSTPMASRSRAPLSMCGRPHRTGSTSSRTRTSRITTCAVSSGPTRTAAMRSGYRPVAYPIPFDGPAGDLLQMMDRHPYRPSHFHFRVRAPSHQELVTQIFDREDKYVDNDSVFAVKDSLIVDFKPASAGADTKYVVDYDIHLTAAKPETRTAAE